MPDFLTRHINLRDVVLPFSFLELFLQFILPVFSFLALTFFIRLLLRRIGAKIEDESRRKRLFLWQNRILRFLFFLGTLLALISLFGAEAYKTLGRFLQVLNTPFFVAGSTKISVLTLLMLIPVFAASSWTGKMLKGLLANKFFPRFGLDPQRSFSLERLLRYTVMGLVILFGLSLIGIDLSALGVLFGVLGIGIGFGLQSLVADFFAGLSLIGMGHIKEGDHIRVQEHDGIIQHIRLMNTTLQTFENETLIVPNGQLTSGVIHNYSHKDRRIVILNHVEIAYESDLDKVILILQDLAAKNPWLVSEKKILIRVLGFAESGISLQLRLWIHDVSNRADALTWNNIAIWRAFKEAGVEIPFPQRVLRQYKEDPDLPPSDDSPSSQPEE